jgi:hypothetical protein
VVIPTTSLVASSVRYPGKAARIYVPRTDWQAECYRHFGICGEARFAAKFFGHACSRATLGVGAPVRGTMVSAKAGPAFDLLTALFAGADGQVEMLESVGTHLTIAGECYLVGRQTPAGDTWEIVSIMEMQVTGTQWAIDYGNGLAPVMLTEDDVVIRIWTPNPARRIEADSPFRSLLPILGEIEWLTRHVFSQITSRLAGAGILFMPQGMAFPPPPDTGGKAAPANEASSFMLTLADAMLTPISDPSSPAASVPIVVTAPDDSIDKAKLLTFWSELDGASKDLRMEAIRRFALGMDLPPEQILGISSRAGGSGASGGVSHWGAWQIEEATIKLHVEPMLDVIVNSLTVSYLRPALADASIDRVTYDSSALRLRPDRSKEAFELFDRGLITDEATRRENGFSSDDAPQAEDFKRWLLRKMAVGSTTPEQVSEAARQLGVDLGDVAVPTGIGRQERPVPSLEQHPGRPRTPSAAALHSAANRLLLAATEPLVFRALERAGNRLRQSGARPPGVPAYETHCYVKANGDGAQMLSDAWSCAQLTLNGLCDDPLKVIETLNAYCLTLLSEGSPHSRDRLSQWLDLA